MLFRLSIAATVLLLTLMTLSGVKAVAASHPMDGLNSTEIKVGMNVLNSSGLLGSDARLISLDLETPDKVAVLRWRKDPTTKNLPARSARAVIRKNRATIVAVVDLANATLASSNEIKGAQGSVSGSETLKTIEIVISDPGMQAALAQRGMTDLGALFCVPRTVGNFGARQEREKRLVKADCFDLRDNPDNSFATPIEGLFATVDLDAGEVVEVTDLGVVPIARGRHSLAAEAQPVLRTRGEAPATTREFTVDDSVVRWENWEFHIGWSTHDGLILSDVRYRDADNWRSVLYEGHLSELYVPYMDPTEGWYFRNYFDQGDYGIGTTSSPLVKGADCPDGAAYLSPLSVGATGLPTALVDRICIFERNLGEPTWRHFDMVSEALSSRPDRDLVVRFIATIGNYDYLFDWILDAKGRITFRGGATGLDAVKGVPSKSLSDATAAVDTEYGPLIAPGRAGINHDHFFSLRLDVDVDGASNRFVKDELYVEAQPEESKRSSIWRVRERVLASEREARLKINLSKPSLWRVQNPAVRNAVGYPVSYALKPGVNALPLADPSDSPLARAGFANHHLWVTPRSADERWAAGEFPNQSEPGQGLPEWTKQDRNIENKDIVLWYTMGFHHVPSSEDWPVYNTGWHSVTLAPYNFFDSNPAIDLPE